MHGRTDGHTEFGLLCVSTNIRSGDTKMSPHLSQLNVAMAHRNYVRQNNLQILKLATYTKIEDHCSRCQLATFWIGKDW